MTTNELAKKIYDAKAKSTRLEAEINKQLISAQPTNTAILFMQLAQAEVELESCKDDFRLAVLREETGATVG